MTTYIDFVQSSVTPFQFQPTLDGATYICTVTWNIFGQRYYLLCQKVTGELVFNQALVGSPLDYDINLVGAYFSTSKLVFRNPTQQFEISP